MKHLSTTSGRVPAFSHISLNTLSTFSVISISQLLFARRDTRAVGLTQQTPRAGASRAGAARRSGPLMRRARRYTRQASSVSPTHLRRTSGINPVKAAHRAPAGLGLDGDRFAT